MQHQNISRMHRTDDVNYLARVAAVEILGACFTLPFPSHRTDIPILSTDRLSRKRSASISGDLPMVSSLQIHSRCRSYFRYEKNSQSISVPTSFRLRPCVYDGINESEVEKNRLRMSRSMSDVSYTSQRIFSVNKMIVPQSFNHDSRLDHEIQPGFYAEANPVLVKSPWNSKKRKPYSRKWGGSRHPSLQIRKSMDNLNQISNYSLRIQSPGTEIRSKSQEMNSTTSTHTAHRTASTDSDISSTDYETIRASLAEPLDQDLVCQTNSIEHSSIYRLVSPINLRRDLNKHNKSSKMMAPDGKFQIGSISSSSTISSLPPDGSRELFRTEGFQKKGNLSEVYPLDHIISRASSSLEGDTLSPHGGPLDSSELCFQSSAFLRGGEQSPARSLSSPIFLIKRKNVRRSLSQINTPDDFLVNAVHYGERNILSLMGSTGSSPSTNSSPTRFDNELMGLNLITSAPVYDLEKHGSPRLTQVSTSGTEIFKPVNKRPERTGYQRELKSPKTQNKR